VRINNLLEKPLREERANGVLPRAHGNERIVYSASISVNVHLDP